MSIIGGFHVGECNRRDFLRRSGGAAARSEILTGPQVLEVRSGRCAEYAVLFASLARAAGIPTRIVVGTAYHDGIWGGHMWNEVWLGDWIAVDPTYGTYVHGPMHLKLIDSETLLSKTE